MRRGVCVEVNKMELIKIKLGTSLFYYIYILFCLGIFFGLYFLLRKKSKKVQYWVLFGFLAFNFVLHFVKLAFPIYVEKGFPGVIRKSSFENICAVSTLIFPFIFLTKSKAGKDYMFYLGTVSGILGCVAPMPVINLEFYQLETIRYYLCHGGIWIVPLLMVIFGLHELDYRRIWKTMVIYFAVLFVIIVNEVILIRLGWVGTETMEEFLDANERDMGYAIGLPDGFKKLGDIVLWMTPKSWRDPYIPVLWEVFPVFMYGGATWLCMSLYWEHEHVKTDCIALKNKTVEIYKKLRLKFGKNKEDFGAEQSAAEENSEENNKE